MCQKPSTGIPNNRQLSRFTFASGTLHLHAFSGRSQVKAPMGCARLCKEEMAHSKEECQLCQQFPGGAASDQPALPDPHAVYTDCCHRQNHSLPPCLGNPIDQSEWVRTDFSLKQFFGHGQTEICEIVSLGSQNKVSVFLIFKNIKKSRKTV